jgi:hypothetical protein
VAFRIRAAPLPCRSGLNPARTRGCTANAGPLGIRYGGLKLSQRCVQWALGHEEVAMSTKKLAADKKPATIVANDPDRLKGKLKHVGGSQSDDWNNVLANQSVQTLWIKNSDKETRDRQYRATVAGLVGIGPKDELAAMIAAQLLAAHNSAMECYRRPAQWAASWVAATGQKGGSGRR